MVWWGICGVVGGIYGVEGDLWCGGDLWYGGDLWCGVGNCGVVGSLVWWKICGVVWGICDVLGSFLGVITLGYPT